MNKQKNKRKKWPHIVIGNDGDRCPRCGMPTEIREHTAITAKHLAQPFYYRRWFYCTEPTCRTNRIMPPEFRVFRNEQTRTQWKGPAAPQPVDQCATRVIPSQGDIVWGEGTTWEDIEGAASDRPPWE
jgi:hypothetical protein